MNILVESAGSAANHHASSFNEHATAYHIITQSHGNDLNNMSPETQAHLHHHMSEMQRHADNHAAAVKDKDASEKEITDQHERAKVAASDFLEHAHQIGHKGKVVHVEHTGAGGVDNYGDTKHTNPSDLVAHFEKSNTSHPAYKKGGKYHSNKNKLGMSCKSSKTGEIGFYNGGMDTYTSAINKPEIGENAKKLKHKKAKEIFGENKGDTEVATKIRPTRKKLEENAEARKKGLKEPHKLSQAELDLHKKVSDGAAAVHKQAADAIAARHNEMSTEENRSHLMGILKDGANNKLDHVKTTGSGRNGKYRAHTIHPDDNPVNEAVKHAHHFTFHRTGNSYTHVVAHVHEGEHHPDGSPKLVPRHVMSLQVKHNDEKLSSSLKVIGQPASKVPGKLPIYDKHTAPKDED